MWGDTPVRRSCALIPLRRDVIPTSERSEQGGTCFSTEVSELQTLLADQKLKALRPRGSINAQS